MIRSELIEFLEENGCVLVRVDKKGYSVYRNVVNSNISGVPKDEEPHDSLVCRICKTLEIPHPPAVAEAAALIEAVHKRFSKGQQE